MMSLEKLTESGWKETVKEPDMWISPTDLGISRTALRTENLTSLTLEESWTDLELLSLFLETMLLVSKTNLLLCRSTLTFLELRITQ